jgi:hypothetical protein
MPAFMVCTSTNPHYHRTPVIVFLGIRKYDAKLLNPSIMLGFKIHLLLRTEGLKFIL